MVERRVELTRWNHPDIHVSGDAVAEEFVDAVRGYFEAAVASGARFRSGETIQIGWSLLTLAEDDCGDLDILEPDFVSLPIQWVAGVSRTARAVTLQNCLCASTGTEPFYASLLQAALAPECIPTNDFRMERFEGEGQHSGWCIFETADAPLRLASLYEIALANRAIVPFLALPVGASVSREGGRYFVSFEGRSISSDTDALLARLGLENW